MHGNSKHRRTRHLVTQSVAVLAATLLLTRSASAQAPANALIDSARAAVVRTITPPTNAPPPPAPSAALMPYLGEYGSSSNTLIVLEHDGALHALFNGIVLTRLQHVRADTFALASDSSRIAFIRNGSRVTGISMERAVLQRRALGADDGGTFKITPLQPIEALRRAALAAKPPAEPGNFVDTDLVELRSIVPHVRYDIRYATKNNFMNEVFYSSAMAFMQRPAAEALARAAHRLEPQGYGILIHDAYRPWYVTKMFWDATPDSLKDFVADPALGSRHNRGAAVDLTLYDLATGEVVTTVSGYDEFSPRAYPDYPGGTARQRWYRAALRDALEAEGFAVYWAEWWHFDFGEWRRFRIGTSTFEELLRASGR